MAIKQQIVSDARADSEFNVADRIQTELTIQNRLIETLTLIWGLRLDPRLLSGIRSRGEDLLIAMWEAMSSALTHGYQSDASKRFLVCYACEANEMLSTVLREEGNGFNPI